MAKVKSQPEVDAVCEKTASELGDFNHAERNDVFESALTVAEQKRIM